MSTLWVSWALRQILTCYLHTIKMSLLLLISGWTWPLIKDTFCSLPREHWHEYQETTKGQPGFKQKQATISHTRTISVCQRKKVNNVQSKWKNASEMMEWALSNSGHLYQHTVFCVFWKFLRNAEGNSEVWVFIAPRPQRARRSLPYKSPGFYSPKVRLYCNNVRIKRVITRVQRSF